MSVAQKDILNGWKEIAGYVARDIRTVERWEKQRGLPVRRVPGAGRATVYARISELEQWLAGAALEPESGEVSVADLSAEPFVKTVAMDEAFPPTTQTPPPAIGTPLPEAAPIAAAPQKDHARRVWGRWAAWTAAGVCFVVGLAVTADIWMRDHRHSSTGSRIQEGRTASDTYSSPVAGVEDLYLRGTYLYEQRTPETLNSALAAFNRAIQLDPKYAPAYAGLANTYNLLREYSGMSSSEAYSRAKDAAQKAIALDPNCAQAHASLGYVEYFWSLDPRRAEQEFHTALTIRPNFAEARHWYGSMLTHEGRYRDALEQLAIAQRLEPSSAAVFTSRAMALGLSGHAEEARSMLRDQLSHDTAAQGRNSITTHLVLSLVYMVPPRDMAQALVQMRQGEELRNDHEQLAYVDVAESALHSGGERAMWQALQAYLQKAGRRFPDQPYRLAETMANLGDSDQAFAILNRLADQHDPVLVGVSMNPYLAPLHADPRFAQLRGNLGLPPQN